MFTAIEVDEIGSQIIGTEPFFCLASLIGSFLNYVVNFLLSFGVSREKASSILGVYKIHPTNSRFYPIISRSRLVAGSMDLFIKTILKLPSPKTGL
jgi:hypothetical protein